MSTIKEELLNIRSQNQALHPRCDFDSTFIFYYDETNNIRKFLVRPTKFNANHEGNFVLGGLVFSGSAPSIDPLIQGLSLQPSVKEVKLAHLAKGDFLECLQSKKISFFLDFLLKQDAYIHYKSVNLLYFALVDIVDSIISQLPANQTDFALIHMRGMKSALYEVAKENLPQMIDIMHRFDFPNIKSERLLAFVRELQTFVMASDVKDLFHLRWLLEEGINMNALPFIQDGEDHVLMTDFLDLYLNNIYMFHNATHVFDREVSIEDILMETSRGEAATAVNNRYYFEESISNKLIQVSDIIVGLLGKFSQFVNNSSITTIRESLTGLKEGQRHCLNLLLALMSKSERYNPAFIHQIDSDSSLLKQNYISHSMVASDQQL